MIATIKNYLRKCWRLVFPKKTRTDDQKEVKRRTAFYAGFIKPGDLCFDIGANFGNRIDPLLALGSQVVAVEPQRACYEALRSKYGKRIEVVPMGIGAVKGIAQLHIANASTISSFSTDWIESVRIDRFKDYRWDKTVDVEMTTLDLLIEKYGLPSFIKIDVEGYETEVLKGLSYPVDMISFEYTVPEQTERAKEGIQLIHQNNSDIKCNFSIGESMNFYFEKWLSPTEMMNYIDSEEFQSSLFGDIYCRRENVTDFQFIDHGA